MAAQHKSDLEDLFAAAKRALDEGRVRPHFLFNALNTIAILIDAGRYTDANRTVLALATLLWYGFDPPDGPMPLEEELRVVAAYTSIQKIRFRDRFVVQVAMPPEAARVMIPPFTVQALVENAFAQIEAKPGPGRVTVTATVHENQLTITVTDDGGGDGGTVACLTLPMQSEKG